MECRLFVVKVLIVLRTVLSKTKWEQDTKPRNEGAKEITTVARAGDGRRGRRWRGPAGTTAGSDWRWRRPRAARRRRRRWPPLWNWQSSDAARDPNRCGRAIPSRSRTDSSAPPLYSAASLIRVQFHLSGTASCDFLRKLTSETVLAAEDDTAAVPKVVAHVETVGRVRVGGQALPPDAVAAPWAHGVAWLAVRRLARHRQPAALRPLDAQAFGFARRPVGGFALRHQTNSISTLRHRICDWEPPRGPDGRYGGSRTAFRRPGRRRPCGPAPLPRRWRRRCASAARRPRSGSVPGTLSGTQHPSVNSKEQSNRWLHVARDYRMRRQDKELNRWWGRRFFTLSSCW